MTDTQTSADKLLPFCDLVMKGGIASGVVYPTAIAELSCHYRFQSIGGTSAGAIAAAVTAAAEYQRRETGSLQGFGLLKALPDELGKSIVPGKSKLLSLFQPQGELSRLFSVLVASLNRGTTTSRILHLIIGFMKAYWLATVAATIAGGAAAAGVGFLYCKAFDPITIDVGLYALLSAAILFMLVFTITAAGLIGWWVYLDITRRLVEHNLGLCSGLGKGALTPWLHNLIQTAADRTIEDAPLTFGDLWLAEGADSSTPHSIDLQMFSTNLSHGRPYIFPLEEKEQLYFTEEEMSECLPDKVVTWMKEKSRSSHMTKDEKWLLELPPPQDFPVLLAARMSLSFPFLFTAIPLHCLVKGKNFQRCWFSDGGISSNFPIHLFDDLLPRWPTFGITLEPKSDGQADVFIAKTYDEGKEERWNYLPKEVEQKKGAGMLGWFIGAIVGTMQNWNDNSLTRMPGVRDRVARVRLNKTEGGLNLNMEEPDIRAVAARGKNAIRQLLKRFNFGQNGNSVTGWDEHRFVRLHILLKMLAARAPGVVSSVGLNDESSTYATDFCKLLSDMQVASASAGPPGYAKQMTDQNCSDLLVFVQRLASLAQDMEPLDKSIPFTSIPTPELRVRPPL
ncbi:MAG TPA: hypothetical protein DEA71_10015 [Nitrospira sp.]|nr:hypothetical protein [Nitrospira sp.]